MHVTGSLMAKLLHIAYRAYSKKFLNINTFLNI